MFELKVVKVLGRRAGGADTGGPGHTQFRQDRLKRAADGPANSPEFPQGQTVRALVSYAALKPV